MVGGLGNEVCKNERFKEVAFLCVDAYMYLNKIGLLIFIMCFCESWKLLTFFVWQYGSRTPGLHSIKSQELILTQN